MARSTAPQQPYRVAPVQKRVIGNRWDLKVRFTQGGIPLDLTANVPYGEFFTGGTGNPLVLTVGNGAVLTDPGTVLFTLLGDPNGPTSSLSPTSTGTVQYPVRLVVSLIDGSGQKTTRLIQPFQPADRRSVAA